MGAIDAPVFLRSTAKPFIAAAAVLHGVVERFGLESRELAVMTASHNGEHFHVNAVRSILRKIGLPESALQCGAHEPYNENAAAELVRRGEPFTAIHNNCSGKHAGILALALSLGADPATYMELENPAQQEILKFCGRMTQEDPQSYPLGIDGCGIPVFATSLRRAAAAFSRFATLDTPRASDASALALVRDAMIADPVFVSGTGAFDTVLMSSARGTIAAKAGAEGVHGDALIDQGAGLVLKVVDGAKRAVAPAVLATLDHLGAPVAQRPELSRFTAPKLTNRAGAHVGDIVVERAIFAQ